jgi:GNAT superfamily N-acetyltransferase
VRIAVESYEVDDDPHRIDVDAAVEFLLSEAYWGRWRAPELVARQISEARRVVGAYDAAGAMVGFARASGDGWTFYLSDVYVLSAHRGAGLGKAIMRAMIDDGPAADGRWLLHTSDAHGLYRQFGFAAPDDRLMERPGRPPG